MDHFTTPCAIHINTHGDLDIPANAEVVVGDDGQYVGFIAEDGTPTAHRGFEANLSAFIEGEATPADGSQGEQAPSSTVAPTPAATGDPATDAPPTTNPEGDSSPQSLSSDQGPQAGASQGDSNGETDGQQTG